MQEACWGAWLHELWAGPRMARRRGHRAGASTKPGHKAERNGWTLPLQAHPFYYLSEDLR
jgi:hypothetical protein